MYNQWATNPGHSLNYPRLKSITHIHTFSVKGVYVALQLCLVILVSDQWHRVLIPYSFRMAPWGILHAWDDSPAYMVVTTYRYIYSPKYLQNLNILNSPRISLAPEIVNTIWLTYSSTKSVFVSNCVFIKVNSIHNCQHLTTWDYSIR